MYLVTFFWPLADSLAIKLLRFVWAWHNKLEAAVVVNGCLVGPDEVTGCLVDPNELVGTLLAGFFVVTNGRVGPFVDPNELVGTLLAGFFCGHKWESWSFC